MSPVASEPEAQTSTPAGTPCRSTVHTAAVPATVTGTFDASATGNGSLPEPASHYCLACAVLLADVGWFTPDAPTVLLSLTDYLRDSPDEPESETP